MATTSRGHVCAAAMLLGLISSGLLGAQEKGAGAKALFYNPETGTSVSSNERTTPSQPGSPAKRRAIAPSRPDGIRYVGVHYWIELFGLGPVTDTRTFRTGDRIRLHVRSNAKGYLTIWSFDPAGRGTLLLPVPGAEDNALVGADSLYSTPIIRFSPPAEDERLALVFSRIRPDSLLTGNSPSGPAEIVSRALGSTGARSLVVEVEERDPSAVGTYLVNTAGGPVATEIRLRHVAP